ncbi:hypothetical protein ACFO0N_01065 [Halobium salinum]|uniref:PQQ-like domain-containing protein n=1 Tax=Halobium salinum TaxID=1364940 RepID=A0ABD5P6Q2_9EURY|nr:hypothetical protein [Halobium salinum]
MKLGTLVSTADDGLFAAGERMDGTDGSLSAFLVRTDRAGEDLWRRTVEGSAAVAALDPVDGGFLVLLGYPAPRLLRLDGDGRTLWTRDIEMPDGVGFEPVALVAREVGGYAIAGVSVEGIRVGPDAFAERRSPVVMAVDSDGHERWRRTFPAPDIIVSSDGKGNVEWGPGSDIATGIAATGGGYLLVSNPEGEPPVVRALGARVEERWRRSYGNVYGGYLRSITPTPEGFVLTGRILDPEADSEVPWLLAIDDAGEPLWSYGYLFSDGPDAAAADFAALEVDSDGSLVVAGTYHPDGHWSDRSRPMLARIGRDGSQVQWVRQYGDRGGIGEAVARTSDGSMVLAGERNGSWTEGLLIHAGRPTASNLGSVLPVRIEPEPASERFIQDRSGPSSHR